MELVPILNKRCYMHRQGVDNYISYIDLVDYPYTCALIAETERDHLLVHAITIRRDIRLD